MKLMAMATIATTAALQVSACTDNSKYDTFISDVNETTKNSSAFFGFLGSPYDDASLKLQTALVSINTKDADGETLWEKKVANQDAWKKEMAGAGVTSLSFHYYQGPSYQDKPSDPVSSFWNDKNITWQQNIFNWIYSRIKNKDFKDPNSNPDVETITTKKDSNNNEMFTKLPIVFIIFNGKLITAGQGWTKSDDPFLQAERIKTFIESTLFNI